MPLNINVELPADTVLAIQEAAKGDDAAALQTVRMLTDRAVLDAVKKLQYYDLTEEAGAIQPFIIFIKLFSGNTITLKVDSNRTIGQVKTKIQGRTGVMHEEQRLMLSGIQLEDGKTLAKVSRLAVS